MNQEDYAHLFKLKNNPDLIYLDNAATSLTHPNVVKSIVNFYTNISSNVHRGVHQLSQQATNLLEETRKRAANFINAKNSNEIIFTKGTTDSINLLASCLESFFKEGDELILSPLEHHSNLIPWQILAQKKKLIIKHIPLDSNFNLSIDDLKKLISNRTKLISITMASNTLGVITPFKEIVEIAKENNIISVLDAAQAAPHLKIDVQEIKCDFLAFSAHKMLGPTGVGVLFGNEDKLNNLPPYQGGGGMIDIVETQSSSYLKSPFRFEAGTPNISGIIAFNEALSFLQSTSMQKIKALEDELITYVHQKAMKCDHFNIYGPLNPELKVGVLSFDLDGIHPNDIGMLLDEQNILVRTGHHCTQPLMNYLKVSSTCRASFAFYNTKYEIDAFFNAIEKIKSFF